MDIIDMEEFDNLEIDEETKEERKPEYSIEETIKLMDSPIDVQKEMAAKIKVYVDSKMEEEILEKGYATEATRKWMEVLNSLLEKMHKEMFGDKHTSMNVHVVTHSDISTKLRKITI